MNTHTKTILLAEDHEDTRELVSFVLRHHGYDVQEAENGSDALKQLEGMQHPPCLLLLDMMMPVMTGPELLRALDERQGLASVPVIVLSAGGQPAQAPGIRKFIRKPVDLKHLLDAVVAVCGDP